MSCCPTCGTDISPGSTHHWHTGPIDVTTIRVEAPDGWTQLAIPPDCDAVAAAVSKDHPDWSPSRRLSEAMRRTKGSANPHMMRDALARYDAEPIQIPNPDAPDETEPMYEDDEPGPEAA